jgi:hypothetical protein
MSLRCADPTPVSLDRYFGREPASAEVAALLGDVRLVTLAGAPGCGKTQLGAEAATRLVDRYEGRDRDRQARSMVSWRASSASCTEPSIR